MRKLKASLSVTLNGVVEAPHTWPTAASRGEDGDAAGDGMSASDALLLGRNTYELFAAFWPTQPDDVPFAAFLNGVSKYVVSGTLTEPVWRGTSVIRGDAVRAVRELKAAPGKDIVVLGSCALVESLAAAGLIDEYELWIHPLVLPSGKRLFAGGHGEQLELLGSRALLSGVTLNTYRPATLAR